MDVVRRQVAKKSSSKDYERCEWIEVKFKVVRTLVMRGRKEVKKVRVVRMREITVREAMAVTGVLVVEGTSELRWGWGWKKGRGLSSNEIQRSNLSRQKTSRSVSCQVDFDTVVFVRRASPHIMSSSDVFRSKFGVWYMYYFIDAMQ